MIFDQDADRVGSLTVAARPPDDPFGLRAGNAVLSSKVADLVGLTSGHAPAVPPASIRLVIGHGTLLLSWTMNSRVIVKVPGARSGDIYPKICRIIRRWSAAAATVMSCEVRAS